MSEGRLIKNKLRIVRQVGRGGMGYVYEAFHEGLRVTRALKQIVGDLQDNPDIERRFLHEAQMMARLEHPHIVRVFDIDQEPDFGTYLLMEFIRGRDLGEMLRQEGRFSYTETLRIGIAVASALDCAHRAGLVHRDIKPANILIEDGTGRPVVTDFGIAKEVEAVGDESFTRTGSFVGTYRYSSREQIRSEKGVPIDGRADVYSLGVVLYEIYAGKKYLAGMPELKIASCVGYQDDWLPELEFPETPPPRFAALLDACIAPDRDKRVRSAAELVDRLEDCRRLDVLGAGPGGAADRSEATLAATAATSATAATTQTAPQSGSLGGELTSTTLDEQQRPQTATETRSQWVALLQGLRGAVDDQAGEFERLLKELIELDIPRDDFRQLDDMSQILHRVERAESEGQYQDAASNLQGLSDRIQQLNTRIEQTLGEAIERNGSEVTQAWRELTIGAGELLAADQTRAFEQLMAPLPTLLEAADWDRCRTTLRDARALLEQARRDTRTAAAQRAGGTLREVEQDFATLERRSPAAAAALGVEPQALAREIGASIEQGALTAALRRGADALGMVRDAIARLDQEERARADAARAAAERARAALDPGEAAELAGAELANADELRAAADAAARRGELVDAASRFEQAAAGYARAAERVATTTAQQIGGARQALQAADERAATAPADVVGEARRAAQQVLAGALPRERRAAVQTLQAATATLEAALAEVGPFEQARTSEAAAVAALERATALGATEADLAAAERLLGEARAAFARRDLATAREAFAGAAEAFADAGRTVVARGEEERLRAARAQIDESLRALDTTLAGEICATQIERALRSRDQAAAAERAGDRPAALAASGEALGALREASEALLSGLGERSAALASDVRALCGHAGELLEAPRRSELERGAQAVERALVQRDPHRAARALDEGWRGVGDARVELDARTRGLASDELGQIRSALRELAAASQAAAAATGVDADALAAAVDTLLGEERFADARSAVADALAQVRSALDAERERQRTALLAARGVAGAARQRVELDAARALARDELDGTEQLFAAAERAEKDGDLIAAARLYTEAGAAAAALQAEVRERQIAGFEAERAALEEIIARSASAADEIVGRARADARALVEATVSGDLRQASSAIAKSRATMETLLGEAELFAAAREQQTLARAAEQRAAALSPSRRQVKAAAGLLRAADQAFARKTWPAAAQGYAKASEAYAALERELGAVLEQERASAQAKASAAAEERLAAEKKAAELAATRERERALAEQAAQARAVEAAAAKQREREAAAAAERAAREQAALEAKQRDAQQRAAREAEAGREAEAPARERAASDARARARGEQEARARDDQAARDRAAQAPAAASATDATMIGDADATVLGDADATRIGRPIPEAQPRRGLPIPALAGGAALLVAAAGLALWLSQREPAVPPPIRTARVEEPLPKTAPAPPVAEQPQQAVPPPLEQPVEPIPQQAQPEPAQPEPAPVEPAPDAPLAEEPAQVAKVAPPSPIAPPPLRISGFTPDAAEVAVKEGAKQAFSIDVAGGADGKKPKIAWRLDDRVVASDVARFEYAPGFDAASDAPRNLEVVVGDGPDAQTRSWRVAVANVNRKPQLAAVPKPGTRIEAKLGDTVKLSATVKDDDGDPIKYAWQIDGKAVANDAAQLEVPVTGDRAVSVTASDGGAEVSASWQIAAIKPVLRLDTTPARLDRLRFEKPQEFALAVPKDVDGLQLEWTVDGKKVAAGPRFTFANDDASKVRRAPVEIAVNARDAQGRTFERSWSVVVEPPPPQLADTTPAPGTIDAESGSSQTFELAARAPIGGQDLSYVFQVDGRQAAKGKSPRFQYRVTDDKAHRITGFVQDNFDQASAKTEWSIAPRSGADIVRGAQSWLDDYQSAFNAKDARRLGQLRGLSADKVAELQRVLDTQEGLRVTFSNVRIDKLDDQRARITYSRSDDFTDARGTPVSRTGNVEQTVGLVNGRVTELETRRR